MQSAFRFCSLSALGLCAALSFASPAHADPPAAPSASSPVAALPTIPRSQPTALPPAEPAAVSELETLLGKLAASTGKQREDALGTLADQDASVLPAIETKLASLRKSADRDAMSRLLAAARKAAREASGGEDDTADDNKKPADSASGSAAVHELIDKSGEDWLAFVLTKPSDTSAFRDLVAVLALERVCVCIGTTASARELINVYTYFGDLFRIDVQRQVARMKDRALPALIEAQYHDSTMVRTWAGRRLDTLGKAIPSEAVRTDDNQVLADVLRAYGRAREVEAVRVIISFANSERLQVREAAREALGQIGDAAKWQLREAYENLLGKKPERDWDWKRTAQELFAAYDRARLQDVYGMMDTGVARYKEGKLAEALSIYDQVLARAPLFERRSEMVPAYLEQAKTLRDTDPVKAMAALRRTQTIDPSGPQAAEVQSQLLTLEAEELSARGIVDLTLLDQALSLDAHNEKARALRDRLERDVALRRASWQRYAAAGAIGVVALGAMAFVALYARRKSPAPPATPTS